MNILKYNFRRFKVITFDCTNTLLYFKNPPHLQYLKTASQNGLPAESFDEHLMQANFISEFKEMSKKFPNFGRNVLTHEQWWEQLVISVFKKSSKGSLSQKDLDEVLPTVAKQLIIQFKTDECWGKFDKSNELIESLKEAGKTVGVISNFDPRLEELLMNMKLPKFDFILTSYEAGVEKPNSEIFNKALRLASPPLLEPSEALHIGNEIKKDFKAAKDAKWSAVLINNLENSEERLNPSFRNLEHFWNELTTRDVKM